MVHQNLLQMMLEKVILMMLMVMLMLMLMVITIPIRKENDNKSVDGEVDLLLAAVVARQVQLVGGARLQQAAVGGLGGSGHHLGGVGLQNVSGWHHHYVTCHITLRQAHLGLERMFGAK